MSMSMKFTPLFLIAAFQIGFIDASQPGYTHIPSTSASYKLHSEERSWYDARDKCWSEGAVLFHPGSESELGVVRSILSVGNGIMHSGFSDLEIHRQYKTLDGRPLGQVYSKWKSEVPNQNAHCGRFDVGPNDLYMGVCDTPWRFICKIPHPMESVVVTAAKDVQTTIANSTSILVELVEAAANQTAASDRLLERVAEADTHQVAAIQQLTSAIGLLASNQTAAIQQLTSAIGLLASNQAASMQQQTAAMQQLTAAIGLHFGNQTAIMERQALALEKIATSSQEVDSQ